MLFSSCVFRHRPRDYARPAARATQTSARATRPDRLLQAWRVAPSSDPRSAHNTHVPARKRMRPAHVELELLDLSKDLGASTLRGRWRRTLQRDEREHHRVWLRPDSCSDLTMLPYFTLATTLGLLLQREEAELDLLLARAPRTAHVTRERSIDRENQDEERRKTCLSCYSRATFTTATLRDVLAPRSFERSSTSRSTSAGLVLLRAGSCSPRAEGVPEDDATRHARGGRSGRVARALGRRREAAGRA